jgi:excinuclease ABC subunit C
MFKRVYLSVDNKKLLEEITNQKLYFTAQFGQNNDAINSLLENGQNNASVYLNRHKLGQRLNPWEENNLFLAVVELQKLLDLKDPPRRIECYDISHLSGTHVYGSMVTFIDGRSSSKFYKLFKCREQNDDFANHAEVLARRLQKYLDKSTDRQWQLPDLIVTDGGKGQVAHTYKILQNFNLHNKIAIIGLAKKEEEIFLPFHKEFVENHSNLKLGSQGGILCTGSSGNLLMRIRDEAHRFAITNNRQARLKQARKSQLDDLIGVGQITKQKILTHFTSYKNFVDVLHNNSLLVREVLGDSLTDKIYKQIFPAK